MNFPGPFVPAERTQNSLVFRSTFSLVSQAKTSTTFFQLTQIMKSVLLETSSKSEPHDSTLRATEPAYVRSVANTNHATNVLLPTHYTRENTLYARVQAKVTAEKTFSDGFHGSTMGHADLEANVTGEGPFAVQTFSFAKVFKDSRIGEAGVMLDVQQVWFVWGSLPLLFLG